MSQYCLLSTYPFALSLSKGRELAAAAQRRKGDIGSGDANLSEESIKLRQHFRTLTPENQSALLEIAKVLNRLQRNS